jgi:hypothetical protein
MDGRIKVLECRPEQPAPGQMASELGSPDEAVDCVIINIEDEDQKELNDRLDYSTPISVIPKDDILREIWRIFL